MCLPRLPTRRILRVSAFCPFQSDCSRGAALQARREHPAAHSGIWILRPNSQSVTSIVNLIERALRVFKTEPTERRLWIVENERIRLRDYCKRYKRRVSTMTD